MDRQDASRPPPETLRLWTKVGTGLDKSQIVVWKDAADSLDQAGRFLVKSEEARRFVETYMKPIVDILLNQQPSKIGKFERDCVHDSLRSAVSIMAEDLDAKADESSGECVVLEALALLFDKRKSYYKKSVWNPDLKGLPEVRAQMISNFNAVRGFSKLATYLGARVSSSQFPSLDVLHQLLAAAGEAISSPAVRHNTVSDTIYLSQAVMIFIDNESDKWLKGDILREHLPSESIGKANFDLRHIFDRLLATRRKDAYSYYAFWRHLIFKLVTSASSTFRLFGLDQLEELIEASGQHRPPPKSYFVFGAGCSFVNGKYEFAGVLTGDGFANLGAEISYERTIPSTLSEKEGGGKKLTVFRCTMRSQQKWWFLSEADEEQPGTDKDIDYYQHKSKKHEEREPPPYGWITCRNAGIEPPPHLQRGGLMVPPGEEYNTLEHQLAKWAIENRIIERVLGGLVHREVVARLKPLIEFLAMMCERDEPTPIGENAPVQNNSKPNAFCLEPSHLVLTWQTCTSKTDAAVTTEVCQLLVSILPTLSNHLAIPLVKAIQKSLSDKSVNEGNLFEVSEFCTALATAKQLEMDSHSDKNISSTTVISYQVRAEVLELLLGVLSHPDSSSLESHQLLKDYISKEFHRDAAKRPPSGIDQEQRESTPTGAETNVAALGMDNMDATPEFSADIISSLTNMGFARDKVVECLTTTNGDPEAAVDLLINNSLEPVNAETVATTSPPATTAGTTFQENLSNEQTHHSPEAEQVDFVTLTPSERAALKALTTNLRDFEAYCASTGTTLAVHEQEALRFLASNLDDFDRSLESVRGLPATLATMPDHVKEYFQIFTSAFERTYAAAQALATGAVEGKLMNSKRQVLAFGLEALGSISSASNVPFLGFIAIFTSLGTHMIQQRESNMLFVFQDFFKGRSRDEYLLTYRAAAEKICLQPDYLSGYEDARIDVGGLRAKVKQGIERVQKQLQRSHLQAINALQPIELKAMDDLSILTDCVLKLWMEERNDYEKLKEASTNEKAGFVLEALGIEDNALGEPAMLSPGGKSSKACADPVSYWPDGCVEPPYAGKPTGSDSEAETIDQAEILRHLEEQRKQNQELHKKLQLLEMQNRDKSARMKSLEEQVKRLGEEDTDIDVAGGGAQKMCVRSKQSKVNARAAATASEQGDTATAYVSEVNQEVRELRQELIKVTDSMEKTRLGVFVANRLLTTREAKLVVQNILLRSSDDVQGAGQSSLVKHHNSIAADDKGCFTLDGKRYQIGKFGVRPSTWKGNLFVKMDQNHNGAKSIKSWFEENGLGYRYELHSKVVVQQMFADELE